MYEKENFDDFVCTQCNHIVRKRIKNSLQSSLALTIFAILLYIQAMIYPIMELTKLGVKIESTILEGVVSFLEYESYFIAFVIFTASIVIPMIKLIGLLFMDDDNLFRVSVPNLANSEEKLEEELLEREVEVTEVYGLT
jgi:paraquat-inducible protein A